MWWDKVDEAWTVQSEIPKGCAISVELVPKNYQNKKNYQDIYITRLNKYSNSMFPLFHLNGAFDTILCYK